MLKECLRFFSKYDWLVHGVLCFLPVFALPLWQMTVTVVGFSIILEYEQKAQTWYAELSWKEYLRKYSIKDLIADFVGIIMALIIRGICHG